MSERFSGKVALVTGASSGIGRVTALAFAAAGARVVLGSRGAGNQETARLIRERGGTALALCVDVRRPSEVEEMVHAAVAAFGGIDCAFNNAGVAGRLGDLCTMSEPEFDDLIATNLKGVWLCLKQEAAQMKAQGGGVIVNMSSAAGLCGVRGAGLYGAAKHGVVGLTRTAALELAPFGIRVNAVCPAVVLHTGISDPVAQRRPEVLKAMVAMHPLGRAAEPEEVAQAVLWLCSEDASFVTGCALPIDGGLLAGR